VELRASGDRILVRIHPHDQQPYLMNNPATGWASFAYRWTWPKLARLTGWTVGDRQRDEHSQCFWLFRVSFAKLPKRMRRRLISDHAQWSLVASWSPRHGIYLGPPSLGSIDDAPGIANPVQDQQLQIADREPPGLDEQLISVVEIVQPLRVREAVSNFGHRLGRVAVAFFFGEGLERRKMCWNR